MTARSLLNSVQKLLDLDTTTPSSSQPPVSTTAGITRKTEINTELLITIAQSSAQNLSNIDAYEKAASSSVPTTPEKRKVSENGENLTFIADADSRPLEMCKSHSAVSQTAATLFPYTVKVPRAITNRALLRPNPPGAALTLQISKSSRNSTGIDLNILCTYMYSSLLSSNGLS
jgi:hypothetical protein